MISTRLPALAASVLAASVSTSSAQELASSKILPMAIANEIALATIAKCTADGFRVSVVVTDRNGTPIVSLRGDGTGPHTADSARRKAYTAASMRSPTADLAKRIAENPGAAALATLPDILALAGGLPVKAGDEAIGGVGVGGAPGGDKDAACAQAGLDAVAAKLK